VTAQTDTSQIDLSRASHRHSHTDANINVISGIANLLHAWDFSADYNIHLQEPGLRFRSEKINILYEKNSISVHKQFIFL